MAGHAQRLAERLRTLYEHAGSPTYDAITAHGLKQQPPVKFAGATLSGWLAGRTVPSDKRAFRVLVTWLEFRARDRPGHQACGAGSWEALRIAAWHERQAGREGLDAQVRGYLEAARNAAEQHPHLGLPGRADPPALSKVYIRQRSSAAKNRQPEPSRDRPPSAQPGTASIAELMDDLFESVPQERLDARGTAQPAEALFRTSDPVCVLIAGPGGGKSTLLRTWLRDVADAWLAVGNKAGKTPATVPVWVSARTLAGDETTMPDALAAATRKLSRYGRRPQLEPARFLARPCSGAHWQVLVDGLDELPNADQRRAVLEKLANAVTGDPPLYRCVVATRPVTDNELDILDDALGYVATRYDLLPFNLDDLHAYLEKYFTTCWPQQEATARAHRFTAALRSSSLTELARTPLMAFMLCQLYLADPDRTLPGGRSAVYEAFTDLIYENNSSKHVAISHEEAVTHLVQSLQSPRGRQEAEQSARQVHQRLPELIDYLAHQRLTGNQAPVAAAVAAHKAVHRPAAVSPERWDAFIEDLLRHTGLLVQHADGLGFPHQTFLEYHAARHAARDPQAAARSIVRAFPRPRRYWPFNRGPTGFWTYAQGVRPRTWLRRYWEPPRQDPSYIGFLIDAAQNTSPELTSRRLARLASPRAGLEGAEFIIDQAQLGTRLSADVVRAAIGELHAIATDTGITWIVRILAIFKLAEVDAPAAAKLLPPLKGADSPIDGNVPLFEAKTRLEAGDQRRRRSSVLKKP